MTVAELIDKLREMKTRPAPPFPRPIPFPCPCEACQQTRRDRIRKAVAEAYRPLTPWSVR